MKGEGEGGRGGILKYCTYGDQRRRQAPTPLSLTLGGIGGRRRVKCDKHRGGARGEGDEKDGNGEFTTRQYFGGL